MTLNENELREMIVKLVEEMVAPGKPEKNMSSAQKNKTVYQQKKEEELFDSEEFLDDITQIDLKKLFLVENAKDKEGYLAMKAKTPARLGIGKAGARYKTLTMLRVRADHAAAQDAVFSDVSEEFIKKIILYLCRLFAKIKMSI